MRLRTDERGVTVQIGTVLLFGVLVILLSIYQASVVPQQNEQVEFTHNQQVQSQLQELRDDLHRTATTGSDGSASVALGTQYPVRAFFVNPASPSGTLRTTPPANLTLENVTATGETGDYWDGSARNFSTRGMTYDPLYHVYQNPPTTVYDNGVLYNRFDGANRTLAGQQLVADDTISLVALNGSLSKSSSGTATVGLRPVSAAARTVTVGNETNNVSILVPTALPADEWEQLLSAEMDATGTDPDRHVLNVSPGPRSNTVRITLEPDTYELELAKVGVGTDVTGTDAHYVTVVEGDNASVSADGRRKVVAEVRDRFNNPVSGVTVTSSATSGGVLPASGTVETGSDGRATFVYEAVTDPDETDVDVEVAIDDGSEPRERATADLYVETGGSDDSDGGDGAFEVDWTDASGSGLDCDGEVTACTLNLDQWNGGTLTASVTENGTDALSQAAVDYSVNDSELVTLSPTGGFTEDGEHTTSLTEVATTNGTVRVWATAGGDADSVRIRITDSADPRVRDPGRAFEDKDGDGYYEPGDGDFTLDLASKNYQYDATSNGTSASLVVPESVTLDGSSVNLKGKNVTLRTDVTGNEIIVTATQGDINAENVAFTSGNWNALTLKAQSGTVDIDGASIDSVAAVKLTGGVSAANAEILSEGSITLGDGSSPVDLADARVDNTASSSGMTIEGTDVTLDGTNVRSGQALTVNGGEIRADDAILDNADGSSELKFAASSLTATNVTANTEDRTTVDVGSISLAQADFDAVGQIRLGDQSGVVSLSNSDIDTSTNYGGIAVRGTQTTVSDSRLAAVDTIEVTATSGAIDASGSTLDNTFGYRAGITLTASGDIDLTSATIESDGQATADLGRGSSTLTVTDARLLDADRTLTYDPNGVNVVGSPTEGSASR